MPEKSVSIFKYTPYIGLFFLFSFPVFSNISCWATPFVLIDKERNRCARTSSAYLLDRKGDDIYIKKRYEAMCGWHQHKRRKQKEGDGNTAQGRCARTFW